MVAAALPRIRAATHVAGAPVGRKNPVGRVLAYTALIVMAILMFVPFIWSVATSFKTSPEAALFPPTLLPQHPSRSAYQTVLIGAPFARWFMNSEAVSAAVVIFRPTFVTMAGYAFARMRFP